MPATIIIRIIFMDTKDKNKNISCKNETSHALTIEILYMKKTKPLTLMKEMVKKMTFFAFFSDLKSVSE